MGEFVYTKITMSIFAYKINLFYSSTSNSQDLFYGLDVAGFFVCDDLCW